jgi:hypothetical protein
VGVVTEVRRAVEFERAAPDQGGFDGRRRLRRHVLEELIPHLAEHRERLRP